MPEGVLTEDWLGVHLNIARAMYLEVAMFPADVQWVPSRARIRQMLKESELLGAQPASVEK